MLGDISLVMQLFGRFECRSITNVVPLIFSFRKKIHFPVAKTDCKDYIRKEFCVHCRISYAQIKDFRYL